MSNTGVGDYILLQTHQFSNPNGLSNPTPSLALANLVYF